MFDVIVNEIAEMIKQTEVTFVTKKIGKEFKVFVCDVQDDGKTIVGWYTNRFGKLDIKRFAVADYNIIL